MASTGNPLWDFLEVGPQPNRMAQSAVPSSTMADGDFLNLPPRPYPFPPSPQFNRRMDAYARFNEDRHGGNILDAGRQQYHMPKVSNPDKWQRVIERMSREFRNPPTAPVPESSESKRSVGDAVYRPDEQQRQFRHPLRRGGKMPGTEELDALAKVEQQISFLNFKKEREGGLGVKDRIKLMLLQKALYGG